MWRAPAAFSKLLSIGKWLEEIDNDSVQSLSNDVTKNVGGHMDSRLATQYAPSIMCAQKVVDDNLCGKVLIDWHCLFLQ